MPALILAGFGLTSAAAFAQTEVPPPAVIALPPPVAGEPAPTPTAEAPVEATEPDVEAAAERRAPERATRSPARRAARQVVAEPAPAPVSAAAEAPITPAPIPAAADLRAPPAKLAAALPPAAVTPGGAPTQAATEAPVGGVPLWAWAVGLLAVIALTIFGLRRRRRRGENAEVFQSETPIHLPLEPAREAGSGRDGAIGREAEVAAPVQPEVSFLPAPSKSDPASEGALSEPEHGEPLASIDKVAVSEPDAADVEALAVGSRAPLGRPWIEFLLRPIRAGTTGDEAVVEFELTVGNTGTIPAERVRLSTWMFAAGSPAESEVERMLIRPPAETALSELTIPPGDGARVEAALALPKTGLPGSVLPVVVADARYRLPDGSEGRTSASFEIGLSEDGKLAPFPVDRSSGLLERVEARLHGELERV